MERTLIKRFLRHGLARAGFEIRKTGKAISADARGPGGGLDQDVTDFIADRNIDVVLDVGANVGQFATALRARGYRGKIVSFEPIRSVYANLSRTAAADEHWVVNNFALGAKTQQATINVADMSVYSSILPSTTAATRFDENAGLVRVETIEIQMLDEVMPAIEGNILLKIDTQGYERQVLEGGRHTLAMMKGVLMELPIIHLYKQTWQFHEAIDFMAQAGFVPAQIHPVSYHSMDRVSLVEVDCLFRPRDARMD